MEIPRQMQDDAAEGIPRAPFLPGLSEELVSKLRNSYAFYYASVLPDEEPTEGLHVYDRVVENDAYVPMLRACDEEISGLRIEVDASDVDRVLTIVKGSFADTQPDKVKNIAVPAGATRVDLGAELYYFKRFRDTYTELSLSFSGPGLCTLQSDFVRIFETPWPQEEKHAVADALEKAVRSNVAQHFCSANEAYLTKVLDTLRTKPLIYSNDVRPRDYRFYRFPELLDTEAFAAWLKQVVDSAVAIPSFRNPEAHAFLAIVAYPDQPAFNEDRTLTIEPSGRALFSARVQATTGVSVRDAQGKPITTEGNPVTLVIGKNTLAVDIVDGEIRFEAPLLNPLSKYTYPFSVQFQWGVGGLPLNGKGVQVVQRAMHFSSVIDNWFRTIGTDHTILPLLDDWSLLYDNGLVAPMKTSEVQQYAENMVQARKEEHARDMAEAQKKFGHLIALQAEGKKKYEAATKARSAHGQLLPACLQGKAANKNCADRHIVNFTREKPAQPSTQASPRASTQSSTQALTTIPAPKTEEEEEEEKNTEALRSPDDDTARAEQAKNDGNRGCFVM